MGGFVPLLVRHAPALNMTDLAPFNAKRVPLARTPKGTTNGIESRDYSVSMKRDYSGKPSSNVASHSHGTTLYGTSRWQMVNPALFLLLVRQAL